MSYHITIHYYLYTLALLKSLFFLNMKFRSYVDTFLSSIEKTGDFDLGTVKLTELADLHVENNIDTDTGSFTRDNDQQNIHRSYTEKPSMLMKKRVVCSANEMWRYQTPSHLYQTPYHLYQTPLL